ncbi:hypothetical protein PEC331060_43870 [Pectobacterium carotovorum subsp. carotovorum]|nr:hypothetical protein PEC331060_43870 [Pectobacterium carotovorum subsp. carotovorum]
MMLTIGIGSGEGRRIALFSLLDNVFIAEIPQASFCFMDSSL